MASQRFKNAHDSKFGRCTKPERQSCACDREGRKSCRQLKLLMQRAVEDERSPIKEPKADGDGRPFTMVPHQGQRLYLGRDLETVMRTYDHLVTWVKAGTNGSYLVFERTALQHARSRHLSKKQWLQHIKILKVVGLIDVIGRHHVVPGDASGSQAYIVLPHPDWAVELAAIQHDLGKFQWHQKKKIDEWQANEERIIGTVRAMLADASAERRRKRLRVVGPEEAPPITDVPKRLKKKTRPAPVQSGQ